MFGYTVGITLILFMVLAVISLKRLMSGKPAGKLGKATGVTVIVLSVACVIWVTYEIPLYERQQARLNFSHGKSYWAQQDYEQALSCFQAIRNVDKNTYEEAQLYIYDLQVILAQKGLEQAKQMFAEQHYTLALAELEKSMADVELEEAKALLPVYQQAAVQN